MTEGRPSDADDVRDAVDPPPPRRDVARDATRIERVLPVALTLVAPIPSLVIPFLGPLAGLLLTPVVAFGAGHKVWPTRRWVAALSGVAVVAMLWLSLVIVSLAWGRSDPVEFLTIPLCAPTGATWLLASLAATTAYLVVSALSVRLRAIWIWPIAAGIGGATMATTWAALDAADLIHWVC